MTAAHVLMAILATWRLTEIMTADRITDAFRNRFTHYFWTCIRCVSVWCGVLTVGLLVWFPWGNWPFAFSWLLIAHQSLMAAFSRWKGRQIVIELDGHGGYSVLPTAVSPQTIVQVLRLVVMRLEQPKEGKHADRGELQRSGR